MTHQAVAPRSVYPNEISMLKLQQFPFTFSDIETVSKVNLRFIACWNLLIGTTYRYWVCLRLQAVLIGFVAVLGNLALLVL